MRKVIIAIIIWFLAYDLYISYNTTWTWFYYPDFQNNPDNIIVEQWFSNSDACLMRTNSMLKGNKLEDYECWSNCRFDSSLDNRRCKETVQ